MLIRVYLVKNKLACKAKPDKQIQQSYKYYEEPGALG